MEVILTFVYHKDKISCNIFFKFREQIKEVPVKLDNFLASKHYLHATDLIVNAGKITDHSTVKLVLVTTSIKLQSNLS